ncbi:hypothetical protein HK103_006630 [Boothiomyces macroporosus]|uniref:DUF2470 domain-containing protein n=1 Tax=Boothiomyces macroporosus TaxID=261099 RepID=A0AAD5UDH5_9FUNG|nr:hypothetical protein HK103_006630 [Boothiomyces macroporosus]
MITDAEFKEILEEYNTKPNVLILFCRYFGNAKSAIGAVMSDIDATGCTMEYVERTDQGLQRKEIMVQFSGQRAQTANQIHQKLKSLVKEAESGIRLNQEVDKTYIPPGRKSNELKLYEGPAQLEIVLIILWWSVLVILAFLPFPEPINALFDQFIGRSNIQNTLIALVVVNSGLALTVGGLCVYAEFPLDILFKWITMTFIFGFLAVSKVVKIAYKRREQLDAADDIGYSSK